MALVTEGEFGLVKKIMAMRSSVSTVSSMTTWGIWRGSTSGYRGRTK